MGEERMTELLVELHRGLRRLGPGNRESTLRAFALCGHLPSSPDVLDIGCGTGPQTLDLARATEGHITAVDLFDVFLKTLNAGARESGLADRIRTYVADMLRPGGYLALSEMCWFKPDAPAELREFWAENYPAMRTVEDNIESASALGVQPVGNFHLPVSAWTEYYDSLRARLSLFREEHAGDAEARQVADMMEHEMSIMARHPSACGYEFFVFRT